MSTYVHVDKAGAFTGLSTDNVSFVTALPGFHPPRPAAFRGSRENGIFDVALGERTVYV